MPRTLLKRQSLVEFEAAAARHLEALFDLDQAITFLEHPNRDAAAGAVAAALRRVEDAGEVYDMALLELAHAMHVGREV